MRGIPLLPLTGLTVELMNLAGFIVYLQKGFSYSSDFSGQGYVRHTEEPLYRLVRFRRRNLALKKKKKKTSPTTMLIQLPKV